MPILKIAKMGNPALRRKAREIEDPTVPGVRALIRDMVETLKDAGGVGLAAPQVHVSRRLVLVHLPPVPDENDRISEEQKARNGGKGPLLILINPVIEPVGEEVALGWEGCLSVPGMRGMVPRHTHIRYSGLAPDGTKIEAEARDFHARVIQHECDHLEGVLYPMRMPDLRLLGFEVEFNRHPLQVRKPEQGEEQAPGAANGEARGAGNGAEVSP